MRKAFMAVAIAILASVPITAQADEGTGLRYNGGGGTFTPLSSQDVARNKFKSQFAERYLVHRKAGGSAADFPAGLAPLERELNAGGSLAVRRHGGVGIYVYPAPQESNSLGSPQYQAQSTDYYCGPASGWVALKQMGAGNNYFGAALTQSNLATSFWLQTDTYLQTPRGSNWPHTLNSWTDGTDTGWYVVQNYGSYADAADVASKFVTDIDFGYAPIMNVWMTTTRGMLPGWSAWTDVKHYVPGYGYTRYGDFFNYIEVFSPATLGYKTGVTKEFFANIVASYGMIW